MTLIDFLLQFTHCSLDTQKHTHTLLNARLKEVNHPRALIFLNGKAFWWIYIYMMCGVSLYSFGILCASERRNLIDGKSHWVKLSVCVCMSAQLWGSWRNKPCYCVQGGGPQIYTSLNFQYIIVYVPRETSHTRQYHRRHTLRWWMVNTATTTPVR